MTSFKEFTFGWIVFIVVIPLQLLNSYFYFYQTGSRPILPEAFITLTLFNAIILILFYGLTTHIKQNQIVLSFGIGLIHKRIHLKRIKSVEVVRSPWYFGWGIRFIPHGMLYNINGTHGVELRFHDTKRVIRIGTPNPERLKSEIKKRLPEAQA